MRTTVSAAIKAADVRIKAAVGIIEPSFFTLPIPRTVPKSATAGQILEAMVQQPSRPSVREMVKSVTGIKKNLYAQKMKSIALIEQARSVADDYLKAAEHIKTGAPVEIKDPTIHMLASMTRRGVEAGVVPATASDQLTTIATQALLRLREGETTVDRTASAGRVVLSKQSLNAYEACAQYDGYQPHEKIAFAGLVKAAKTSGNNRLAMHREVFNSGGKSWI